MLPLAVIKRLSAVLLVITLLVAAAAPSPASAHAMPTSAVVLDIGSSTVSGEIQIPVDRLAVALGRDITPVQAAGSERASIEAYVAAHVSAVGADGTPWKTAISGGHIERINKVDDLVVSLRLTPASGKVTNFVLQYDAVIEQLVTHRAIATIRTEWDKGTTSHSDPVALGVFDWSTPTLEVNTDGGSWLTGVVSMGKLGVEHIGTGSDHLLFLLMLLIPAPLIARGGRWRRRDDPAGSARRVVHVVTAFAVGHSITLALASLGVVHAPERVVESLIALSILVSAIHALRPLVPGGEAIIAAGFGLVHGLAFATLLSGLGLSGGALASSLLGFNLGIEATQLLVVALMMPSFYLLSRSAIYGALRVSLALFGVVLSTAWLLERTTLIGSDPFEPISQALIDHPFFVAAAFALLAVVSRLGFAPRLGRARDVAA